MRAVDSNIVVRLITRDHPTQVDSAEQFVEPGAWVSLLALAESVWVLKAIYALDPEEIASAIDYFLNHKTQNAAVRLSTHDGDLSKVFV